MSWTHIADSAPKARKDYRCLVCGETIPKGLRHVARSGFGDDGPYTFRMHDECAAMSSEWKEEDWECHLPGDVERPKETK